MFSSSSSTTIAAAATYISTRTQNVTLFGASPTWGRSSSLSLSLRPWPSLYRLFFRIPRASGKRSSVLTGFRPVCPLMEWQDCTVKMEIDVPASVAYNCYSDREAIPRWMPFISTVKILEDKPDLSRWSLKYKAFGRDIEFSWLARNMQPIPNQKIHWRSLEGLPNRGAVRFYPKGPSSCTVELTVSYEVPQILTPVASALQPFLENLLQRGLERFATFAKSY
ncbi:Coenzyme Q-binding protein COQ10, START domain containing protein [Parasponia andersonii]|uniref:Coenzyme Q-binding protein COQ10, START domain containing protein n=1 Tax=Parasponia andersonii TaxID=3476 RepID=A0A2P5B373_PARAD|nr:Coenzyme Q-binding protein COQ10, START domain containing protein [Parasponia andersonii]